jgi:hypothetical protein
MIFNSSFWTKPHLFIPNFPSIHIFSESLGLRLLCKNTNRTLDKVKNADFDQGTYNGPTRFLHAFEVLSLPVINNSN